MKSGVAAGMPATCAAGEMYFATDIQPGGNLYGCIAGNWTREGATTSISSDGTGVGASAAINFVTGVGLTNTIVNTGQAITVQIGLDSAVVQTLSGEQSGTALLCASTTNSPSSYQCSLNPTLSSPPGYMTGMLLHWRPDVNGAGGVTSLNVDQIGPKPLMLSDGVSSPGSTDIVGGQLYNIWYDGNTFRLMTGGTGSGNSVSSVFGRTGPVTAQAGDYSAAQITGLAAVATSGSYTDLTNRPTIPAAQVNSDWNASSGITQIFNKPHIPSVSTTSSLLKGDAAGNAVAGAAGADYLTSSTPISSSQLPAPRTASLGGIQSKDCSSIGHVQKIGIDGTVTCSADSTTGQGVTLPSTTSLLKGDGLGGALAATPGTEYSAPNAASTYTQQQTFAGSASLGSSYESLKKTVGTGGVAANKLCKLDGSGNAVMVAAGDPATLGVCMTTQVSGSSVEVAILGVATCIADNATSVGDLAIVGTTTPGACADSGQTNATTIATATLIVGRILTAVSAGQPVSLQLYGPGRLGTQAPTVFSNTGIGSFWPFGCPQYNTNSAYSALTENCMTSCPALFWEFEVWGTFTGRKFAIREASTADAGKFVALAVFDASGNLVAQCTTGMSTSTGATVLTCPFAPPSSYTFTPGTYYLGFTGNTNVAYFNSTGSTNSLGEALPNTADTVPRSFSVPGMASLSGSTFTWAATLGVRTPVIAEPLHVVILP